MKGHLCSLCGYSLCWLTCVQLRLLIYTCVCLLAQGGFVLSEQQAVLETHTHARCLVAKAQVVDINLFLFFHFCAWEVQSMN